jgi:hypothetical protein
MKTSKASRSAFNSADDARKIFLINMLQLSGGSRSRRLDCAEGLRVRLLAILACQAGRFVGSVVGGRLVP